MKNTFFEIVNAIEENNKINNAQWSDWDDLQHVIETYGDIENDEFKHVAKAFLSALIRDNGENLEKYKDMMNLLEFGQCFSR